MRKKNLYIFIISLCFTACENKSDYSVVDLFNKTKELKNQALIIDGFRENILNPADMQVINNRLILIDVQSSAPFSVIDLHKQKYLKSFGKKGEGPGDIIGVMDFYVNNNETGINFWDIMLRRLYFCDKDSMIIYSNKCGVNLLENFKNKEIFNRFFTNVIQVDDSLFLALGSSGDKRFSLINIKNNNVLQTGNYPKLDMVNRANSTIKANAYNGKIRYNKEKKRVVYISLNSEMIEIFNINKTGLDLVFGNYTTIPVCKPVNASMGISTRNEMDKIGRNLCVTVSDEYIFILCHPRIKRHEYGKNPAANDVLVFDWDGKPIIHYKLDNKVISISVTKNSKLLYALINNEEPQIIYYNLNI